MKNRANVSSKILISILMVCLCVLLADMAVKSKAATVKPTKSEDGNWEYLINGDRTITVTKYTGEQKWLAVPEKIDNRTVTVIGERAFEGCSDLFSITFPDSVTEISEFAFNDCSSLSSITLPDKLTEISDFVFDDCSSLTGITIPDGVVSIGVCAFYGCSSLQSITLPYSVISIGNRAFSRCKELTGITIPESVVSMGELVFDGSAGSLVVYTPAGSYAEKYAKEKNITVQTISSSTVWPTQSPVPNVTPPVKQTQTIQAKSVTKTYESKPFLLDSTTDGDGKLSYFVANKKVVVVSSVGKVTIKGYGRTTVTIKAAATTQYKSATKKITITVIPKTPALIKVSSQVKRQITCLWTKLKNVTAYQVDVSTNKNFKKGTISRSVKGKLNSTKTPPLLKSGTTYYVRVRAYKQVGKTKYFSKWSKVKKVRVK